MVENLRTLKCVDYEDTDVVARSCVFCDHFPRNRLDQCLPVYIETVFNRALRLILYALSREYSVSGIKFTVANRLFGIASWQLREENASKATCNT